MNATLSDFITALLLMMCIGNLGFYFLNAVYGNWWFAFCNLTIVGATLLTWRRLA